MTDETKMEAGDNPADFTVDQVTAHLTTADPAEFARVKAAESTDAGGKGRKGVLDYTQEGTDPEALEPSADGYTRRVVSS